MDIPADIRAIAAGIAAAHPLEAEPIRVGRALRKSQNDETPFTEAELLEADRHRAQLKDSGELQRRRDEAAITRELNDSTMRWPG